ARPVEADLHQDDLGQGLHVLPGGLLTEAAVSPTVSPGDHTHRPASLLVRTNLLLAASAIAIVVIAMLALNRFVIDPIAERSADDEAALLVLTAEKWVAVTPEARPYFELELAENHDLFVSAEPRELPLAES